MELQLAFEEGSFVKKIVAFLLCLVVVLSLLSCQDPHEPIESDSETPSSSEGAPIQPTTDYGDMIELYRQAIDVCSNYDGETPCESYAERYGITDTQEKEFFCDLMYGAYSHYAGEGKADSLSPIYKLTCGYAQKDLNGDGVDELVLLTEDHTIFAIFSCVDGEPRVIGGLDYAFPDKRSYLENCWIDGDGFIYEYSEGVFEHKIKYKVAQGGALLETVAEYWIETWAEYKDNVEYVTKYYTYDGDEEIEITESEYRALEEMHGKYLGQYSGKEATKEHSGLEYVPLFSEDELIKDIYDSVLTTKTKVYEVATGEFKFLKDVRTPYEQTLLADVTDLLYGFADLNGDGIDELVIDCGDRFILQYNNRRVCLYAFTPDWENPQVNIEYLSMDESWNDRLSKEEAHEIACKYLGISINGESTGALGTTVYYDTVVVAVPDETNVYYHILYIFEHYHNLGDGTHSLIPHYRYINSELLVNSTTGECFETEIGTECLAIENAEEYLGVNEWECEIGEGIKTVTRLEIADYAHCDDPYYRVVLIREYYVYSEDAPEDVPPYKVETLKEIFVDGWTNECMESLDKG